MKTWQLLQQQPQLFSRYFVKEYVTKAIRQFFDNQKYHEFEPSILSATLPPERYVDALETKLHIRNQPDRTAYLIPSAEAMNKKLITAGLGNHYSISKAFRDLEDDGPDHSTEFTIAEWYHPGIDYKQSMDECEQLIKFIIEFTARHLAENKTPLDNVDTKKLVYQDQIINLDTPWYRMSMREAFLEYGNIKLESIQDIAAIQTCAKNLKHMISEEDDWQTLFEILFLNEVEPKLPQDKPLFLYNFPRQLGVMSRPGREGELDVCERYELYIAGKEIANGSTELQDIVLQSQNFRAENVARAKMQKPPVQIDGDLITATESLPLVSGVGMGVDRVAILIANAKSINDINYFPANELFN